MEPVTPGSFIFIFPMKVPFCPAPVHYESVCRTFTPHCVWWLVLDFGIWVCCSALNAGPWSRAFLMPTSTFPCCPSLASPPSAVLPPHPYLPSLRQPPQCFLHPSSRPCKCTDHLDFKTAGPLFISGQAAAWFYGVIKVLTGVIKASNCTAETLGVYFKGPWVFILLLLWGLVKASWREPSDWLLSTEVVKITALDKLFQSQ